MNIGLPGTGLGALFYIVLVLAMPLRALWARWTRSGRSSSWRFIARQYGMALGMLSVFGLEMLVIGRFVRPADIRQEMSVVTERGSAIAGYLSEQASRSAISSLAMTIALLLAVHGIAWLQNLRARQRA